MQPALQLCNTDNILDATDVTSLINRSFLQLWHIGALYIDDPISRTLDICDHAIFTDGTLLLIADIRVQITHQPGLTKQLIQKARHERLSQAHQRLTRALNYIRDDNTTIYSDSDATQPLSIPPQTRIFLLCITDLSVTDGEKTLTVTHRYGSTYYAEECVMDHDDEQYAPQLFSLKHFAQIIDTLPNIPDLTSYLICHKTYVVSGSRFDDELNVLQDCIETGEILVPARSIETNLIKAGMRQGMDPKLLITDANDQTEQFITLRKNAMFWDHLVTMYASQIPMDQLTVDSSYRTLLAALMNESIYSRNNLVGAIADFPASSEEQKREGYIIHMRSYANDNRHYVLLFYANDTTHPNHRINAKDNLKNVASAVNFNIQEPPMDDIVVIGIEDKNGNFGVDMYYMAGQAITAEERENMLAAHQAKILAQKQLKGHAPTDFSAVGNMPASKRKQPSGNAATRESHVRPIEKKNAAAQKYDELKSAPKKSHARPQPRRNHIKRLKVNHGKPTISTNKGPSSRNALCPCGSGKKFRHCHGANIDYSA